MALSKQQMAYAALPFIDTALKFIAFAGAGFMSQLLGCELALTFLVLTGHLFLKHFSRNNPKIAYLSMAALLINKASSMLYPS